MYNSTVQYYDGTQVVPAPTGVSGSGGYYSPPVNTVATNSGNLSGIPGNTTGGGKPIASYWPSVNTQTSSGSTNPNGGSIGGYKTPGGGTITSLSQADYIIIAAVVIVVIIIVVRKRRS